MDLKITEENFLEFMEVEFPSFKISSNNLAYPTSDFVVSFYRLMIETMIGIDNADEVCTLTSEQCTAINANPGEGTSFLNHIYARNLHAAIRYIINEVNPNVPEFRYSDILLPENTPRRTFVFMSFMLNCFYHFVSFSEELNDEMLLCDEKGKEIKMKKDQKNKLINQLKEFESQKTERAEMLKNIKASILKYNTSIKEKEGILKELLMKENLVIEDVKKLEEKEKTYENELIRLENNISHYKSLIVQNPNEAAEIHASNEMTKIECSEKRKNLEEQVMISSARLSQFNKVIKLQQMLNKIISKSRDSDPLHKDFKELQNSINDLNMKLSNLKMSESKLTSQFIEKELVVPKLKSDVAQLESEQAAIICKGEERCRIYKEYIENQEKSYKQMSMKMKNNSDEIDVINESINDLSQKCVEIEKNIKEIDNEAKEKYNWCNNEMINAFCCINKALSSKTYVADE